MSELFYANLPDVSKPHAMATLAHLNLSDFEDYLRRAKKQIERSIPKADWKMDGKYHSLSSDTTAGDVITKILEERGSFELRFLDDDGGLVKLPIRYTYTKERVFILDQLCEYQTARLTHFDDDDQPTVYNLSVDPISSQSIGNEVELPHYRVELEATDDSEEGHLQLRKFFDDYTSEVRIVNTKLIDEKGLKKATQDKSSYNLKVKHKDFRNRCIHLTRIPIENRVLVLRPNTYVIDRQLSAIRRLKNSPLEAHRPLIRLFEGARHAKWPACRIQDVEIDEYKFLQDGFSGVELQREFVRRALATPDFAILEGPPGSGKTAVITEIILQAIEKGERVLLSASTHVAVDNVIERLKDENNPLKDEIMLVRIGDESKVSGKTAKYTLDNFVDTELRALRKALANRADLSEWQLTLRDTLDKSKDDAEAMIRRLILNSAQIICGTTIGILQHPEIKQMNDDGRPVDPAFDMLILDEASKTTFSEFIVPALHTKKWVIVGDCRQLSPYVDDREIEVNVSAAFDRVLLDQIGSKEIWRNRCMMMHDGLRNAEKASVLIEVKDDEDRAAVMQQAMNAALAIERNKSGWNLVYDLGRFDQNSAEERLLLSCSPVVIGSREEIEQHERFLPLRWIHLDEEYLETLTARSEAVESRRNSGTLTDDSWEAAVTWRMKKEYEKRLFTIDAKGDAKTLIEKLHPMFPSKHLLKDGVKDPAADLLNVFKVGFPSVLESLQFGFGRGRKLRAETKTAITHGLPEKVLNHRHVALEYQHRMHPSISAYPRETIYGGELLLDADGMDEKRQAFPEEQRVIWIDVPDGAEAYGKTKMNRREVEAVITRLKHLHRILSGRTHPEGGDWSIAVLTFYTGQERALRDRLRKLTGQHRPPFRYGNMSIDLCTSDRFQGHEADVVILSYVRTRSPGFLDSPNRLNVAITRARYQMIHVGRMEFFERPFIKKKATLLHGLVSSLTKDSIVTDVEKKKRHRS